MNELRVKCNVFADLYTTQDGRVHQSDSWCCGGGGGGGGSSLITEMLVVSTPGKRLITLSGVLVCP